MDVYLLEKLGELKPAKHKLNVLLIADTAHPAITVKDHIFYLISAGTHQWKVITPFEASLMGESLNFFDAIVIHYSVPLLNSQIFSPLLTERLAAFPGVKLVFRQDEYQFVNRYIALFRRIGVNAVISSLSPENIKKVYKNFPISFYSNLPGYFSPRLLKYKSPPIQVRQFHLIYRGRELPFWIGRVGREKSAIVDIIFPEAIKRGLNINVSSRERDRIYGKRWIKFILSGKAMLGVEGGASVFDFDGSIQQRVLRTLLLDPFCSFEEIYNQILKPVDGVIVHRTITPRIFEGIALKTVQVLFPGEYRGVIRPWEHYLPLERDGSNIDEVLTVLEDNRFLQEIANRAFDELTSNPRLSYNFFVYCVERLIEKLIDESCCHNNSTQRTSPHFIIPRSVLIRSVSSLKRRKYVFLPLVQWWARRWGDKHFSSTLPLPPVTKELLMILDFDWLFHKGEDQGLFWKLIRKSCHKIVPVDVRVYRNMMPVTDYRFDALIIHSSALPIISSGAIKKFLTYKGKKFFVGQRQLELADIRILRMMDVDFLLLKKGSSNNEIMGLLYEAFSGVFLYDPSNLLECFDQLIAIKTLDIAPGVKACVPSLSEIIFMCYVRWKIIRWKNYLNKYLTGLQKFLGFLRRVSKRKFF